MKQVKKQYHTQDLSQEIIAMIGCITGFKGMEREAREGEKNMCKAIDAIFEQERIKTEERMRKEQEEMFEQERIKTEERMKHEGIEKLVQILKEFECETKEIYRRLYENYNLSWEEAEVYLR